MFHLIHELFISMVVITSTILINTKCDAITIKCDFRKHSSGCDNGAICDQKLKHCVCRHGYAMAHNGQCLRVRDINETCTSSVQCRTLHSACITDSSNYSKWKCQCVRDYWFDGTSLRCVHKLSHNEQCSADHQCQDGLLCAPHHHNSTDHRCRCADNYVFNSTINDCQHINTTACADDEQWNYHNNRCESASHYSNISGKEAIETGNAIIKTSNIVRPSAHWSSSTNNAENDEHTDEKILEIILEISFLIVCLLAYQACSKACCPNDDDDDVDVKSDEESMIGTTRHFKRHRRVRKVFCKSRTNSTQRLCGTPVHHKYKNVIVNFDDNSKAGCYNCRIYQEAYSPGAKCKDCRTSITTTSTTTTTTGDDDNEDNNHSQSKTTTVLLTLPQYKLKPIRRSEEVGVPPHLKAPYNNNQPFWLK